MAGLNTCDMCEFRVANSLYFAHVKTEHSLTSSFYAKCPFPGCAKICRFYSSFKRHWYKCKKNNLQNNQSHDNPRELMLVGIQEGTKGIF